MKNTILRDLEIIDAGADGKAVAKLENGLTVFVPFVAPGDVVDVLVTRKKKTFAEGRMVEIKKESPNRVPVNCGYFGTCGGCKWLMLNYESQLQYKQKLVEDNFKHLGKFPFPPLMPILASKNQLYYRNKLEYTFTNLRWLEEADMKLRDSGTELEIRGLGFHVPGKFDKVIDIEHCQLQADPSNAIRNEIRNFAIENDYTFYNIRHHNGLLRNLVIRTASTGELMVIVIATEKNDALMRLMEHVKVTFPTITSLQYIINQKLNDTYSDLEVMLYYGSPTINEQMEDLVFQVGPKSFYQTNSEQAYYLYSIARDFAEITPDDVVYDLYTGTGTIANFVARGAKKVVGVEYVEDAIADAKVNSRINNIKNTEFYAGDMKDVFTQNFIRKHGAPDVIITDPPRAGMHPDVVQRMIESNAKRIVYISCHPATQVRDIELLSPYYDVIKVQPVDMFPHTHHVENVTLLQRKTL